MISIIVAIDENMGIGKNGGLLCHLPNDLKHFKQVTTDHTIIMGRKTYESLPNGALPNRINIVITSAKEDDFPGCVVVRSVDEALAISENQDEVFIIGGGKLYHSTFSIVDKLYLTHIHNTFEDADTFFPHIDFDNWLLIEEEKYKADEKHKYDYSFKTYLKRHK